MKPRILVLNQTCLDRLEQNRAWIESQGVELIEPAEMSRAAEADALILPANIRTFPSAAEMEKLPRLKVCSIAASGFEWLDVDAATRLGIVVTNVVGGGGADVVADMTFALMLAVTRQIVDHHNRLCAGDATRGMCTTVFGKTLGIIGYGNIGRGVAKRSRGFDMNVIASDPKVCDDVRRVPLDELLAASDFVSLHVRLTEQTRGMIGRREIALMKPTAFLINTARQELVDEEALTNAILAKKIAGAAIDDPPGPAARKLCGLPNVVFTPHIGNRAIEGVDAVFRAAIENAVKVLRSERPANIVNPQVLRKKREPQMNTDGHR